MFSKKYSGTRNAGQIRPMGGVCPSHMFHCVCSFPPAPKRNIEIQGESSLAILMGVGLSALGFSQYKSTKAQQCGESAPS